MKQGGEKCDPFYGPTKCKSMQRKHARYQELKQIMQTREKITWRFYRLGNLYTGFILQR